MVNRFRIGRKKNFQGSISMVDFFLDTKIQICQKKPDSDNIAFYIVHILFQSKKGFRHFFSVKCHKVIGEKGIKFIGLFIGNF